MLYLDFIEICLGMFSKKYFRDILFHEYLELSHDSVPNIRLRFVSLLPSVRKTLRLPTDNSLLQKLTDALEPLLTRDLDRDVVQATGDVFEELGLFGFGPNEPDSPFTMSRGTLPQDIKTSLGSLTDKHLNNTFIPEPDESLDKQKEQEEHDLLVKEWTNDEFSKKKYESKKNSTVKKTDNKKAIPSSTSSSSKKKGSISITPRESTTTSPALTRSATTASSTPSKSSFSKKSSNTSTKEVTKESLELKSSPPLMNKMRGTLAKSASYKPGTITPKLMSSPKVTHSSSTTTNTGNLHFDAKLTSPRNGSAPLARHATDIPTSRSGVHSVTQSIQAMGISPPNTDKFTDKFTKKSTKKV